jgi:[acyl-carrier-protein] S-malonyltransferase
MVEKVCDEVSDAGYVACANYNCPGQIVISGEVKALEKAGEVLKEKGAKRVIPLSVSAPFHCKMLKGAGEKLAAELEKIEVGGMEIPVYANVTGEVVRSREDISGVLTRQVSETVKWTNTVRNMINSGVDTFFEIGPGKVLCGLIRKTDRGATVINVSDTQTLEEAWGFFKRG